MGATRSYQEQSSQVRTGLDLPDRGEDHVIDRAVGRAVGDTADPACVPGVVVHTVVSHTEVRPRYTKGPWRAQIRRPE